MNTQTLCNLDVASNEDITEKLQYAVDSFSTVLLPEGDFLLSDTIYLGSDVVIKGVSKSKTRLFMKKYTNCNIFTNKDYSLGSEKIELSDLYINGNGLHQERPESQKKLSFCNAVYLAKSKNLKFSNLIIEDCHQTALHFNNSSDIHINNVETGNLGWSGLSTSGSERIVVTKFYVYNSGNDHRHSAIHLDGGGMVYLECVVDGCVGNGVMLDSTFSPFSNAVVVARVKDCMRGVALIGSDKSMPSNIVVKNSVLQQNDVGLMVSNSRNVFVDSCEIVRNRDYGVLFQGRVGGCDSMIIESHIVSNGVDIDEIHQSRNNYIVPISNGGWI